MGFDVRSDSGGSQAGAREGTQGFPYPSPLSESAPEGPCGAPAQVQAGDDCRDEYGATTENSSRRIPDRRLWLQQDPGASLQGERTRNPYSAGVGGLRRNGYRA